MVFFHSREQNRIVLLLKEFRKIHKYELENENNFVHKYFLVKPIEMKKFKRTDTTKKRWSVFCWMNVLTLVGSVMFLLEF